MESVTQGQGFEVLVCVAPYIDPPFRYFVLSSCSALYRSAKSLHKKIPPRRMIELAIQYGYLSLLKHIVSKIGLRKYARNPIIFCSSKSNTENHFLCIKFLQENGFQWRRHNAAEAGHIECLKYAHENGCSMNYKTCSSAAGKGNLECLRYAHENECEWYSDTCSKAAEGGHLECLKYAHENGCEWESDTCSKAAEGGHLECLRYAHENGCEWDSDTSFRAAAGGHLECLRYAHENGCDWKWKYFLCYKAAKDHPKCLRFLSENE